MEVLTLGSANRSMVYVDGEITVGQYQDANGQTQRSISITQRTFLHAMHGQWSRTHTFAGSLEVLKRPSSEGQQEGQ